MAIRNIYKEGEPILRKKSKPVGIVDDKVRELIKDLFDTMYSSNGVGLAAPQVGILKRIFVADPGDNPVVLINPEIIIEQGEQICVEGCLSVPETWGEVKRPKKVVFQGLNQEGKTIIIDADDFLANILCHENDHLDGILFKDKVIRFVDLEEKNSKGEKKK